MAQMTVKRTKSPFSQAPIGLQPKAKKTNVLKFKLWKVNSLQPQKYLLAVSARKKPVVPTHVKTVAKNFIRSEDMLLEMVKVRI